MGTRIAIIACVAIAVSVTTTRGTSNGIFAEPDAHVLYTVQPQGAAGGFGFVAEAIGDIDGDAAPEFVIGAPGDSEGGFFAGAVYVYSGRTGVLLRKVKGPVGSRFGSSVAAAADINKDGVPDYVVGGPGGPFGPPPQVGRVTVLSGATHEIIFSVSGDRHLDSFGFDVNAAGDVNGDGFPDLIVGVQTYTRTFLRQGAVTVISGTDGTRLWTREGGGTLHQLGGGVSGIGDVTGDGLPDVAASADGAGPRTFGETYVFSGIDGALVRTLTPNGVSAQFFGLFFVHDAGDVDADGVSDIYVGDFADSPPNAAAQGRAYVFSGATGERVRTMVGEFPGDGFGGGRGIGDVNGDGHGDLVVASYNNGSGGKVYVFSGKNGHVLRTLTATSRGRQLGIDVLGIGDVNGDGKTDILITGSGIAHVVAGS